MTSETLISRGLGLLKQLHDVRAGHSDRSEATLLEELLAVMLPMDAPTWAAFKKQMWRQWPGKVMERT